MERERCPKCGGPASECADPERDWFPQRTVCYAEMVRDAVERKYERLHEHAPYHDGTFESWAKEPSVEHPYHFKAGVTIWVADHDVNPDDDFLRRGGPASGEGE